MPSIPLLILFDLIGWIFMAFEIAVPAAFATLSSQWIYANFGWGGIALSAPFLLGGTLISFCGGIAFLRLFAPKLREGEFPFPSHPVARAWAIHFQIARLAQMTGIRPFFMGTTLLRFLLLRSLGAKNAFRISTSSDLYVYDASMIEIGEGVLIGGTSGVVGHYIDSGKLTLLPTKIGAGCQLMTGVLLGPGTELGEKVSFGSFSRTAAYVRIGAGSHIGLQVTIEPQVTIGKRALIGNHVIIGPKCDIGDRAIVESGSNLPKGTKIPPGGRFPPTKSP